MEKHLKRNIGGCIMSMYGDYLKEKTSDQILESEDGFATFRYLNDGKTVYIVDLYVKPALRQKEYASSMADLIVDIAKAKGAIELLGTVVPSSKNSTISLQVLIGYGMTLSSSTNDLIVFRKDI